MQRLNEKDGGDSGSFRRASGVGPSAHRLMAGAETQALPHDLNRRGRSPSMAPFAEAHHGLKRRHHLHADQTTPLQ